MKATNSQTREVAALLTLVAAGSIKPVLIGKTWYEIYAGNVSFNVLGYKVVIFNDCDSWDYIDSVKFPSGLEVGFGQWFSDTTPDEIVYMETPELYEAMTTAFSEARP